MLSFAVEHLALLLRKKENKNSMPSGNITEASLPRSSPILLVRSPNPYTCYSIPAYITRWFMLLCMLGSLLHHASIGFVRRYWAGSGSIENSASRPSWFCCRYMYFAIDEAGTHVGSKTFRLIAAVHDESGTKLLSTACSQPIRQGY